MRNGEFFANGVPSDRWESMKQTFKINQHDWQKTSNPDAPIVFVLQPQDNWSMNELNPVDWFLDVYKKLRPLTKRKFIVRPHPNHVAAMENRIEEFPADVQVVIGQKFFKGDEKKHYRFHFQDA